MNSKMRTRKKTREGEGPDAVPCKINLCSICDPTDPSTWSGTPLQLCKALNARDRMGDAFDADLSRRPRLALNRISRLLYGEVDVVRTPVRRYASALKVARRTAASESRHTLHAGTLTLPFLWRPPRQHHYLYCDSTWNLWSRYATDMGDYSRRMKGVFEALERKAYSQVRHVFAIGHYVKANLVEYYGLAPERVTVVGTGRGGIKPFRGEKDYASRKMLFIAKNRFRDKGGHLVLEAFTRALRTDPALRLTVVAGDRAPKLPALPNVTVLGFIPLAQLQELFNTHALFLLPAFNEPWGLVYLEAMACKMPIMGLQRNSFPELSGDGKYGIGVKNPAADELSAAMVDAFKDPDRLRVMGTQAQADCLRRFSWTGTVDRILQVVDRQECYA